MQNLRTPLGPILQISGSRSFPIGWIRLCLTKKIGKDLERVQKSAVRVILKGKYTTYKEGLRRLNIETLDQRRERLCLRFAQNCLKNEKVSDLFPKNQMRKRKTKKFKVNKTNTKRYQRSAIPYMQNLLNQENYRQNNILKGFS